MKITDIEVAYLKIPTIKLESNGTQDTAVILIHTDEGITGIGEVDSAPTVVKAIIEAPRSHSVMTGLREVLIGAIRSTPPGCGAGCTTPRSITAEAASWSTRSAGSTSRSGTSRARPSIDPLCELLGGTTDVKVRAYASALFGRDGCETGEKAARFKEAGYTAFKFGWQNFGRSEKTDRDHLEGIRRAVGPDAPVMVDVGWAYDSGGPEWDLTTAIARAKMLAEYDVYWLEEPLHPDKMDEYGELSDRSPVRIAAGEELATVHEFRDLIERGRVHVLQPDVSRAGGVTETMRIAALAQAHGKPVVPHHFKTGILGAVSVHINASIPNRLFQETPAPGEGSVLNTDLVHPKVQLDAEGCIVIPKGPGLGVELDMDVFRKYRVE